MYNVKKLIIGLTGGIASGKTLASNEFATFHIDIIDADKISRELVIPHSPHFKKIVDRFGEKVLTNDDVLNRKQLGDYIFQDKKEKKWLEELLHPAIKTILKERIALSTSPYCIVAIPLLKETGPYSFINRILVIDSPEELQKKRLKDRDHFSEEKIDQLIKAQANRKERLAIADDIIENTSSIEALNRKIKKQHQIYLDRLNIDSL